MDEPDIQSYARPLSLEDKQELIPLNLGDADYVLAFRLINDDGIPPADKGKFYANITLDGG